MVPNEISLIMIPTIDFFLTGTRLPPHTVQRIPRIVRLMMILSKSNIAIAGIKFPAQKEPVK